MLTKYPYLDQTSNAED
eukprot:g65154.t1